MKGQIEAVHPELRSTAEKLPAMTFTSRNIWLWRFMSQLIWTRKKPADIRIENIHIPRQDHQTSLRIHYYRPKSTVSSVPTMLWLHGGGYVIGKPEQDDECCFQYARELGMVIVSVDYRLAPKHPFPAALEDAYSALKWATSHAEQLGIDPSRIAIGGASAGGGLAAALAQLAHDRKEIQPVFQLLVYPMLDDRSSIRADLAEHSYFVWSQANNRFAWESYLGTEPGVAGLPPFSVPSRRVDLTGLPPAWIGVGTLDLFHDEDVAYGQRLKECGVPCEIVTVPGAFHGFDLVGLQSELVRDFRNSQISTMKQYI